MTVILAKTGPYHLYETLMIEKVQRGIDFANDFPRLLSSNKVVETEENFSLASLSSHFSDVYKKEIISNIHLHLQLILNYQ